MEVIDLSTKENRPKGTTIDVDSTASALIVKDDTMLVFGNKHNRMTIILGAITMLPRLDPELYFQIINLADSKRDEIFAHLSNIEARQD
jgi:hypothetical protein